MDQPKADNSSAPTTNPMSLVGRSVIVTGAARGIGLATAQMIVDLGGNAFLVDKSEEGLKKVITSFPDGRAAYSAGDVSDPDFAQRAVTHAIDRFGKVDGLVNNAGIVRAAMISKMTLDEWRQVIDVHLTGSFLFMQAVASHMISRAKAGENVQGSIVNISSDAGLQGTIGQINYASAKAGILGATMSAARELARYGVRVNAVAFGVVETPMTETIRDDKFKETYLSQIPLARWSDPREAASPVCFLLSEAASYITGQRISANGGRQMAL